MILELFARKKIDPERIGVTYCYTPTGETCSVNGSAYFGGASLYKLTEMMGLARMVAAGEYDQEDMINGMTITYIEDRCLTYSDNNVGESILMWYQTQLGGMAGFRRLQREIAGVPEEELPADFYSTLNYSSDFTMGVLKELYALMGDIPKEPEKPAERAAAAPKPAPEAPKPAQESAPSAQPAAPKPNKPAAEQTPAQRPAAPELTPAAPAQPAPMLPEQEPTPARTAVQEDWEELPSERSAPGWLKGTFLFLISLLLCGMTLYAVAADVLGPLF